MKKSPVTSLSKIKAELPRSLLVDVRHLIESARQRVASSVNAELTLLYWHVGRRIREDVLAEGRAEYGKGIVHALSAQLTEEFGRGYTPRNLFNMMRFAEVFPDERIMHALRAQLTWSHLRCLIYLDGELKRGNIRSSIL